LVAKLAVEAFDKRILRWLAWLNQFQLHAVLISPLVERFARELRPLIRANCAWITPKLRRLIEYARHVNSGDAVVHHQIDGLFGKVIDDGQAFQASTVG